MPKESARVSMGRLANASVEVARRWFEDNHHGGQTSSSCVKH